MEQNGGTQERDNDQDHDKYSNGEHGQEWKHDNSRVRDWEKRLHNHSRNRERKRRRNMQGREAMQRREKAGSIP